MQQPDYSSAPYYQYPAPPNPNPNSTIYASAPPSSSDHHHQHPPSYYPTPTYPPPYPLNPDPIPPTAPSFNPIPNANPNLTQFTPNSIDQQHVPYSPPPAPTHQNSYYPQFDQHQGAPNYPPPNPNPSYSASYVGSTPPVYDNPYDKNASFDQFSGGFSKLDQFSGGFSKLDHFGGGFSKSDQFSGGYPKLDQSSGGFSKPEQFSGLNRTDSGSRYSGDGYGYGDGVYAYQGNNKEPYGARGTGPKSSTWSSFDDFGRPIGSSSGKGPSSPAAKVVRAVPTADSQQDAKSGVQKFRVKLLAEGAGSTMDVLCQIGLDGIRMLDPTTNRTQRIYPLETVTRYEVLDSTIFAFWAKSPVDIEPRRIRLKSNSYTSNTILDIVTAATIQFKEIGGRSKPSESLKLAEQTAEKKKGLGDWMNMIKPANEEKDHWVPDEAVMKCTSCGTDFSAFVRKHHCRNCGDIFCDKCTQGRTALTAEQNAQPVRVCDRCLAEVTHRLNIAKEATTRLAGLQSHEDLAKKLQDEMERNRKVSSGSRSDGRRMKEVACPTCTVHLQVQVPSSGSETIECGVCQHPFLVSAH